VRSIPQPNAKRRLGAPSSGNHETDGICHTLDIVDQGNTMISGWLPSAADLAKLNAGEPLFLHIKRMDAVGTHPVLGFSVGYEK
jgi:hypothetical protein